MCVCNNGREKKRACFRLAHIPRFVCKSGVWVGAHPAFVLMIAFRCSHVRSAVKESERVRAGGRIEHWMSTYRKRNGARQTTTGAMNGEWPGGRKGGRASRDVHIVLRRARITTPENLNPLEPVALFSASVREAREHYTRAEWNVDPFRSLRVGLGRDSTISV